MVLRIAAEQMTTVDSIRAASNCGCITLDDPTDDEIELLIDAVSDAIARVSGMKVKGRREYIARPCREGICYACPCCELDAIPLGDDAVEVDEVWIDGVQLADSEYALHPSLTGWNLVRLRSAEDIALDRPPRSWPSVQERWRNYATETRTFAILFTAGVYVDDTYIERAANELVCDLLTEETRKSTSLGTGVTRASVGGVDVSVSSDRISATTERLQRITAGEMGPAFTRMMGIFAPKGRTGNVAWAPELLLGWSMNFQFAA